MIADESTNTVKSTQKKEKLTRGLLLATLVASLGSFQNGYCYWMVHTSPVVLLDFPNSALGKKLVIQKFKERLLLISIMVYPSGGILGSLFIGYPVDMWGRKRTLVIANCVNIFAAFFLILAKLVENLKLAYFACFVFGISAGIMVGVVTLYIIEISPPHWRGCLYIVSQLTYTSGNIVVQMITLGGSFITLTGVSFLASLAGIVAIFNIIMWHYMPESPRFLFIQKEDESAARKALNKLRGDNNVEEELEEMRQESLCEKDKKNLNMVKLLSCRDLRKPLLTTVILMMGNQLTGISGMFVYASSIYVFLNFSGSHIHLFLMLVNLILLVEFIIMAIFIDSIGRRFPLLLGFMFCSITCIILAVTIDFRDGHRVMDYFNLFLIITSLIVHTVGPGPIPRLLTGELFLQSSRGSAYMLSGFMSWFTNFLVRIIFFFLEPEIESYSLLLFWPFSVGVFVYVYKMVPETKGRTFLEVWKGTSSLKRLRKKSTHKKEKSQPKRDK